MEHGRWTIAVGTPGAVASRIMVLIIPAILLVGCTAPQPVPPPITPIPSATAAPATPTAPVPTPTLPTPATEPEPPGHSPEELPPGPQGPSIEHFQPGELLTLTRIAMTGPTTGWAVAPDQDNDDHIVYTHDGGLTWEDHSPPEPAGEPSQGATPFFLDDEHAWVIYSYTSGDPTSAGAPMAWSTSDGGESWLAGGNVDYDIEAYELGYPIYLTFIDPETGWLALNHGAAAGSAPVSLFKTNNGGQTWELMKEPFSEQDEGLDICCSTGLAFGDQQTGLTTKDPGPVGKTYQLWTSDAGRSWVFQEPSPADQDLFVMGGCTTRSPVGLPAGQETPGPYFLMVVDCFQPVVPNGPAPAYIYSTQNSGQTWDFFPLPDPPFDPVRRPLAYRSDTIYFFDRTNGWLVTEAVYNQPGSEDQSVTSYFYQTSDGGQTWTPTGEAPWPGQFSFVDNLLGWGVTKSEEQPSLFSTADGGKSWQEISPLLEP